MALSAVGYDPGSRNAKAAWVERKGNQWFLRRAVTAPLNPKLPPAEAVKTFWQGAKLPKGTVSAVLGTHHLTLREFRHPLKDPVKIAQTIRYESEPYLATPLEKTVLQYRLLGEQEGGTRVLLLAAPKDRLSASLAAWRAAGLDPQSVVADATALWNCYVALGPTRQGDSSVLLMDLGAQKTILALFDGKALKLLRVLRVGFAPPADKTDPVEALKASADVLVQEARRSWATVGTQEKLAQVFLTGGGALHPAVPHMLTERFRCPVGRFKFLARMGHNLPGPQVDSFEALGAVAVGAALAAAGADAAGVDFRQEEFRYRGRLPRLAVPLAAASLAAAALLSLVAIDCQRRAGGWEEYRSKLAAKQEEARTLITSGLAGGKGEKDALGEILASAQSVDVVLDLARDQLKQAQQAKTGQNDLVSVLDVLKELFQRIPESAELTVTEVQAGQASIILRGTMPDENSIYPLHTYLDKPGSTLQAAPANPQAQPNGTFAFTLTAARKR